jgi:PAP2 superfamily
VITRRLISASILFYSQLGMSREMSRCTLKSLLFSTTQVLDESIATTLKLRPPEKSLIKLIDRLPPPPATNALICTELHHLHQLRPLRAHHWRDIHAEKQIRNFTFDGVRLGAEPLRYSLPVTLKLLSHVLYLSEPLLYIAKLRFDRVRPSFVDPVLTTVLPVPRHPAFPSGHAYQATVVAEILSQLSPSRRSSFIADALRIATNREIAGLHYSSDSIAGARLARDFVKNLCGQDWFQQIMGLAAHEWQFRVAEPAEPSTAARSP